MQNAIDKHMATMKAHFNERFENMEKKLETDLTQIVEDKVEEVLERKYKPTEDISKQVEKCFTEMKNKEVRAKNLMIFKLPEPDDVDTKARVIKDKTTVLANSGQMS